MSWLAIAAKAAAGLALIATIYASSTPVGHSCDGGQSSVIAVNGRREYRDSRVTVEAFVRLGWFA